MTPYYDRDGITIYNCSALELMASLPDRSVDLVLTDPPYLAETHKGARRLTGPQGWNKGSGVETLITFAPMTLAELDQVFAEAARAARRWIVATVDWLYAAHLKNVTPAGATFIRCGVWVKRNGAPQFTGDRPAQGWEAIAMLHATGVGKMRWHGGGRRAVWTSNVDKSGRHPTEKPIGLVRELVTLFSDPGDLVVDPFMGSGTTLRACADTGRRAIGCDISEQYCAAAAERLAQRAMSLDVVA